MPNLNKIIIAGRLTKDPETKTTPDGTTITNFSLAVNRYYKDKEETEFFNVVTFNKTAENVGKYLSKGTVAIVEGRLQTRNWEDKEGNKRTSVEVVADNVQFGPKQDKTQEEDGEISVDNIDF